MSRLSAFGAEVVNEWLTHAQIDKIQSRYDVIVLPYIEASQSGVVMSAFGAGIPVIVTPVGGLSEQVEDGVTGLVAQAPSGDAIADCIRWMANDRALYSKLIVNIGNHRQDFSVTAFAEKLLSASAMSGPRHLAPAVTVRSLWREPRDLVPRTIGPALQAVNRVIRLRRLEQQPS